MASIEKAAWFPMLLATSLLSASGCWNAKSPPSDEAEAESTPVAVQVAAAKQETLRPELDLVGTVVAIPEKTAMISPQIAGWVENLSAVEGDVVKADDPLVLLDARGANADLRRADAAVAEKEAALKRLERGYLPQEIEAARQDRKQAEAEVAALKVELAALDDLLTRGETSPVTHQMKADALNAAEASLSAADARLELLESGTPPEVLDEARAQRDAAIAERDKMRLAKDWCVITSPIGGVVVRMSAHQGQFLDQATPLATVVDMSSVFIQLRIPVDDFAKVDVGAPVDVVLESLPGEVFHGTVSRTSGQAETETGNLIVFALVPNDDGKLRPGLTCRARILLPEITDAVTVPVAAVADHSGASVVTVIRDGKAYETPVEVGVETHDVVQILSGVLPDDIVATSGGYGLPEGCEVSYVD